MTWDFTIRIGDILLSFSLIIAALAIFLNFLQIRKNRKQNRAEHLIKLNNDFWSDEAMQAVYYKIEYNQFVYSSDFHMSPDEQKLDKLLCFFENVSKLYLMGNINIEDLKIVAYEFLVVFRNEHVQAYLDFVKNWSTTIDMTFYPYESFYKVGSLLEQRLCRSA